MAKTPVEQYSVEVERGLGYLASWPPTSALSVGDVGVFHRTEFEPNESLASLGVEFEVAEQDLGPMGFASEGAISVDAGVDAQVGTGPLPGVGAAGRLLFARDNAVFFWAANASLVRVDGLDALKNEVLRLQSRAQWKDEWRVVTQVIRAQQCLVLVSSSKKSSAAITVEATTLPELAELADGRVGIVRAEGYGMALEFGPAGPAVPLFQAYRIKRTLAGGRRAKRVGRRGRLRPRRDRERSEDTLEFVPHAYEDE